MTPDKQQKNIEKVKEAMDFFDKTHITTDDAEKFFKILMQVVKGIKDNNFTEWKLINEAMQKIPDRMMSEMMSSMSQTEKQMVKDCMSKCEEMCAEMDKKHIQEMAKMSLDVKMIQADREMIIEDALARVPVLPKNEGVDIAEKLESIKDEDDKLKISAISHLREELDKLKKTISDKSTHTVIASQRGQMKVYDLSDQLNGVLKTFTLPAFWRVVDVKLWSAPALRPTVDYTTNASVPSVTFTSQIDAATLLATGQTCLVIYQEP